MTPKEIIGVAFPVPHEFMKRFFEEGKTVFVKNSKFTKLRSGSKVIFYASHQVHAFVGEGIIESLERLPPRETIQKYGNDLFLTEKELMSYARKRNVAEFLVVRFSRIKEYQKYVKPKRFISMAGRYVTESEYKEILSQALIQ